MGRYFRLRLTITLISFSLIISIASALFDYNKLKDELRAGHENKIEMAGDAIISSLTTLDEIYKLSDRMTTRQMRVNFQKLFNLYEGNPAFSSWDFQHLKKTFDMDVSVIDAEGIVISSSYEQDIGINYNECCSSFATFLRELQKSKVFYHEGMNVHEATGKIKTFGYMATPDGQYIVVLSKSIEDEDIFKQFNFLNTVKKLEDSHSAINSIHVYSEGGLVLGYTDINGKSKKINDELEPIFREVMRTNEAQVVVKETDEGKRSYRYVPHTAFDQFGYLSKRVVEIDYNEVELEGVIEFYRNDFIGKLIFILVAVTFLSMIIARLIAQPIYLAFHDSLTGLKNRAAFETEIEKCLKKNSNDVMLMMMDIDNFKQVNDKLGHIEGDKVLVRTAQIIQETVGKRNTAARLGGDEFTVIFTKTKEAEVIQIAKTLLLEINAAQSDLQKENGIALSISIGIAKSIAGDRLDSIYGRADQALYHSKENGKNQFTFYNEEWVRNND